MTVLTDLVATKTQIATELAAETANPQPTYSVKGRSISWGEYRKELINDIAELNKLIQQERGAVEIRTIVLG